MTPLPASLVAQGLTAWPSSPAARRLWLRGLGRGDLIALASWAHANTEQPPTLPAWAAVLGVSRHTVASWRHRYAELRALPIAPPKGRQTAPMACATPPTTPSSRSRTRPRPRRGGAK